MLSKINMFAALLTAVCMASACGPDNVYLENGVSRNPLTNPFSGDASDSEPGDPGVFPEEGEEDIDFDECEEELNACLESLEEDVYNLPTDEMEDCFAQFDECVGGEPGPEPGPEPIDPPADQCELALDECLDELDEDVYNLPTDEMEDCFAQFDECVGGEPGPEPAPEPDDICEIQLDECLEGEEFYVEEEEFYIEGDDTVSHTMPPIESDCFIQYEECIGEDPGPAPEPGPEPAPEPDDICEIQLDECLEGEEFDVEEEEEFYVEGDDVVSHTMPPIESDCFVQYEECLASSSTDSDDEDGDIIECWGDETDDA